VKLYTITVALLVDENKTAAPSLEDVKLAIECAITTPDNDAYGIVDFFITGQEQETIKCSLSV
jgi:hypothetical protein